ncbi:MAG: hypothetical protein MI864_17870 [Pseudomonadales bacterium]|nr:hypothetical protein [Pseudomonadales bacterium]
MCNRPGMVRATEAEYQFLAKKVGAVPFATQLVLSDGRMVGCRSNQYAYILPIAYKIATGKFPKNYHENPELVVDDKRNQE